MIDLVTQEKLRSEYNPDGSLLRRHQLKMLEMLAYIDDVCMKHGIKYWICSGTLLGAVRHGGFIPWDDDVDIEMLREDYKKLMAILKQEIREGYALQTHETDSNYFLPFAKLRDLNSELIEPTWDGKGKGDYYKYQGIFIDIFPLERSCVPLMKFSERCFAVIQKLSGFRGSRWGRILPLDKLAYLVVFHGIVPLLRLWTNVFSSSEKLYHTFGLPFFKPRLVKYLYPLKRIAFENREFNAPNNADGYLEVIYGKDYLSLPPKEQICFHSNRLRFLSDEK